MNYRLNPFFRIQFGPPIRCELLLENKELELPDTRFLSILSRLNKVLSKNEIVHLTKSVFDIEFEEAESIVDDMIKNHILISSDKKYKELDGVRHWINRGWLDALIFHLKTRDLPFADVGVTDPDSITAEHIRTYIDKEGLPEFWKVYMDKEAFVLPNPNHSSIAKPLEEVLLKRRTHQPWKRGFVTKEELSNILHFANLETIKLRKAAEVNWEQNPSVLLNSAFSALETYFFAFEVEGLEPGLYHYNLKEHKVHLLKAGLFRKEVSRMCIGQERPGTAACTFVISAIWDRYLFRYRHPRAYRTLLINISELAQKYLLLATSLDFSTFVTPAIRDEYADKLMNLNGYEEAPLYVVSIG
jgi:SagB-type dehydrogenase family enzyme